MRRSARAAVAIIAFATGIFAGTAPQAREWPSARLLCDDRGNLRERNVIACPEDGKAYPDDGKVRDGIVVELRGFPYTVDRFGFPQTAIDHYWFREDGSYVKYQKPVLDPVAYPGKGIPLAVQPGDVFTGRMQTLPAGQIGPGIYTILFQARVPCTFMPGEYCNSPTREIPVPPQFKPANLHELPSGLLYGTGATRSEFAWAKIRILGGERPKRDSGAFRLICPPAGGTCVAGSPFEIKTPDSGVPLECGGPIKFYKDGDSMPWQVILQDGNGKPVFGSKNYPFKGFGNMPGAGKWKAFVTCVGEPPILLGEYLLPEAPKPPPPPPRVVPVTRFNLAFRIGRKTLPQSYNAPYPAFGADEVYPGMELRLAVDRPSGWSPYSDREPERFEILLDGEMLTTSSTYAWDTYMTLPATVPAGPHRLTLRASHFADNRKIEFEGTREIKIVGMPAHPRLSLSGPVETGVEAAGAVAPVFPGMEVESVEVPGYGNSYYPVTASAAAGNGRIGLKFIVPLERIWSTVLENGGVAAEKQVALKVSFKQKMSDSEWHRFQEIYPLRVGIVCRGAVNPRLEASPADLVLRPGSTAALKISGFPCGDRISVHSEGEGGERIDWGIGGLVGPGGGCVAANGSEIIEVMRVEERVSTRTPRQLVFIVKGESGREARSAIRVTPATYIEVSPRSPKTGQWIQVKTFGFKANAYVHLYLGEAPLTHEYGKPLEAGQPLDIRLPEGVAGRQTVRLRDNEGNESADTIDIEGEGAAAVCVKPCVKLPPRAKQGEAFDAVIGGFLRNEQLIVRFGELFEVGKPYQRDLMVKQSVRIPRDLGDGRYRVTATSMNEPVRSAATEIDVGGGYQRPTLAISCPRNQPGCQVPRFTPGESVNAAGFGWMVKGRFRAVLIPEQGPARAFEEYREGCVWGIVNDRPQGVPCDEEKGEINKFWALPDNLPAGPCVIEVSDGAASARAEFRIEGAKAPPEKTPDNSADKLIDDSITPPAPPDKKPCNPDLPKIWQQGCVEPGTGNLAGPPSPEPKPTPQPICDSNRPRYAQPGCVEPAVPAKDETGRRIQEKCKPNIPSYAQPGCIP
jgi:hypothetical protein